MAPAPTSDDSLPASNVMRRPGISRDRTGSMSASTSLASPPSVDPEPAYIAATAASQIVTSDHQNQTGNWFDETRDRDIEDPAIVAPASLALVNAFLDQLLFNFLASARSTSVASLRPAVSEVLRPRLAEDAISGADEELHEFLGGGDEEELSAFHNGLESRQTWDLNLVWRRTRLRCMVYTRLGDMEEEDEESFVERERLEEASEGHHRLSRDFGIVSPAAAIFLTSILEFVGEQALIIAGEAAYSRVEAKAARNVAKGMQSQSRDRVVVEDSDIEKIAFNTTLGRLWRSWKKRVRSPMPSARTISRDFSRGKGPTSSAINPTSRHTSVSEADETASRPSTAEVIAKRSEPRSPLSNSTDRNLADDAACEPLVEEASMDGRSAPSSGERRPSSMILYPQRDGSIPLDPSTSVLQRRRSSSLPALQPVPYVSPSSDIFKTSKEALEPNNNSSQSVHEQENSEQVTSEAPGGAPTTMSGGALRSQGDSHMRRAMRPTEKKAGKSKEEFDREMLELVREMKPRSMLETVDSELDPSLEGVDGNPPFVGSDRNANAAQTHKAVADDPSSHETPASQGVDRSTIEFWRGTRDASEKITNLPSQSSRKQSPHIGQKAFLQGARPRAASGGTNNNDYGRMWERQEPHIYPGPSASAVGNETSASSQTEKALPTESALASPTTGTTQAQEAGNGAPPLTPLRELMEAAHDTSDEASSLAPSQDASRSDYMLSDRLQHADAARAGSLSRTMPQIKPASKLSDLRSHLPAVNTGLDRAAVQRVMPSPVSAREPLTPIGRTSTSSNRDLRLIQTSSSSTSQVSQKLKGLVGRDSSDARRPDTSRRSSEESGSMASDKRSLRTPKAEDAQRSFDQLIQSDETIQYTLTPQNMREMEVTDSPRWSQKPTDAEIADPHRRTGTEEAESAGPVSSRSKVSLKGLNGLRSNPTSNAKASETPLPMQPISRVVPSQAVPLQAKVPSRPTTSHSQTGVARDARTKDESFREFADFLRSTGPAPGAMSPQKPGPPIAEPRPVKALPAASARPPSQQGLSKKITKPSPQAAGQKMVSQQIEPTASKRPPPKLQAREATVSSDSTSALADFIRQGPDDRSEGRMRLPRTGEPKPPSTDMSGVRNIANGQPSRSPPDTNGIQAISSGKSKDADNSRVSVASTQVSSAPSKSVHSVNSRTGLLEPSNGKLDGMRTSGSREGRPPHQDDPSYPARKPRRMKDPYAIDTDSDDENAYQTPPKRQEESLIEFLNSVTPPSPPGASSKFTDGTPNTKSPGPQKNRYPSMRERLTRNGVSNGNTKTRNLPQQSVMGVPSITNGKNETKQPASSSAQGKAPTPQSDSVTRGRPEARGSGSPNPIKSQAPQLPPINVRETSPHLVSQIGTKFDTYRITSPTYAAHVDRDKKGPRPSPIQQQQPRGEREPGSGIGDLAEFLKHSGPPTNVPAAPLRPASPMKEKEREGGFGRMFSRRKKSIH